jgi:hypothetical protein
MSNIFDSKGQLNAADKTEALQQLVRYASVLAQANSLTNIPGTASGAASGFSEAQRDALLSQALMTQEGKVALGQAMANPIRRNLDYQGVGRKALVVDPLPQGALPVYDKDIDVAAAVISSNGAAPESRVQGDRVMLPELEIVSNPTVRIAEVKRRRFNVIDRAQQKARQEIQAQEDANIFAALDYSSGTGAGFGGENIRQGFANGTTLEMIDLLNIKKQIDRWDLVTTRYFMNITQFTDILGWAYNAGNAGANNNQFGGFDPVTTREVLQTGLYGHIWGADIIVSKIVPDGTVYGVAEPEFVGVFPVRQDIEVLPADEPRQLKLGWVVSEIVGVGVVNPRGVAAAVR